MKDFISKLTFGFLMAQLVPGVIVVYAISFAYIALTGESPDTIGNTTIKAIEIWNSPLVNLLIFFALSLGAGMAIHGLHWSVLGFLEWKLANRKDGEIIELRPVYETFWHDFRPIIQIILGPIKIIAEILYFLFTPIDIKKMAIEENIPVISKDKIEAFNFLQDFYLNFLQFYAHTAYALIFALPLIVISIIWGPGLLFSYQCIISVLLVWIACGFFFLISRIQMASLFKAENLLKKLGSSSN